VKTYRVTWQSYRTGSTEVVEAKSPDAARRKVKRALRAKWDAETLRGQDDLHAGAGDRIETEVSEATSGETPSWIKSIAHAGGDK
jgi:hypothetical protein